AGQHRRPAAHQLVRTHHFWDDTAALVPAEAAQVLAHEAAHVRQGHTYDVLWLESWRAVLWFNPFIYPLVRALALTHELLADRAALAETTAAPAAPGPPLGPAAYATLLARLATRRLTLPEAPLPLLHSFTHSLTLTRIAMLKSSHPVRRWKQWLALPAVAGLLAVACQPAVYMQPNNGVAPPPPHRPPPRQNPQSIILRG
ncbi:M56 family metallopeptidase, partial [Hymenobacter coccineus]|uniref:M56 family metallopeptidase n=1 Tax=Hymenobacter coccineus TaxID=1908235 RepID=UPI000AA83B21